MNGQDQNHNNLTVQIQVGTVPPLFLGGYGRMTLNVYVNNTLQAICSMLINGQKLINCATSLVEFFIGKKSMYQPACLKFSVFIQLIVPHLHFPILWPLSLARYDSRRGKKVFLPCVFGNRERNRKEKKDMLFLLLCLDKVKKATKFYRQKSNFRVLKSQYCSQCIF